LDVHAWETRIKCPRTVLGREEVSFGVYTSHNFDFASEGCRDDPRFLRPTVMTPMGLTILLLWMFLNMYLRGIRHFLCLKMRGSQQHIHDHWSHYTHGTNILYATNQVPCAWGRLDTSARGSAGFWRAGNRLENITDADAEKSFRAIQVCFRIPLQNLCRGF
jgi:hypothetical protein